MIKRPSNWDSVQTFSDRPKLPLGAYVCRIKQAAVQQNTWGDQLALAFDIIDGEYANFYAEDFKANTREDKKWKGVLRYFLPRDDGSEKDELTKSSFKGLITAIENSNPGYNWNWDEKTLTGKELGIIFRNEEWEYNEKTGWAVRPWRATTVDNVADGKYTLPKDKPLKRVETAYSSYATPAMPSYSDYAAMDDESMLPF